MPDQPSSRSILRLPPVPEALRGSPVAAWREPIDIDTYEPLAPDRYPMFLESRVYQGSSGKVYPLPFHERVDRTKRPRSWDAIHLENRWLRLMILPELGGRIHVGMDKTTGYDFFYRNNVIKPALVGLAGPWISGGVEFNWPQHHRPATFLPVDVEIQAHDDGAVTVWCSDHDPFHRMKGMHGITLLPDRAVVELRVRLYNRTEDVQTFLWWANVAARVHDKYQSFFPPDVHVVADHARRATTGFPRATEPYYGVDYPSRVNSVSPDADRLDWYRNIPVPTSYMCVGSTGDFFGGYDHAVDAGFVHWADHRISPGKKQWTWGNDRFGRAWDRNLTDDDGPYVELMAGVYTDNQPDFSFLAPGETKSFRQYWYPIQRIGPAQVATTEVAASLRPAQTNREGLATSVVLGVAVTRVREACEIRLETADGSLLWSAVTDLAPDAPLVETVALPAIGYETVNLIVRGQDGTLLRWHPADENARIVTVATELPEPANIPSNEELYLAGLHLAQYRHATRRPEAYWEEALRRDRNDSRSASALAARAYERGELQVAEDLLRRAIQRLTMRNGNPYDNEPHYRLGLVLLRLNRHDEAYDAFAKAAWSQAWRAPSYLVMARLRCALGDWPEALRLLSEALSLNADNLTARDLRVLALRKLGQQSAAAAELSHTLDVDPLDWWARDISGDELTCDARTHLDIASEYAGAGFFHEALHVIDGAIARAKEERWSGVEPIALYRKAQLLSSLGRAEEAHEASRCARVSDATYCFPHGFDDEQALRDALKADPGDGRAAGLLGHLLYDCGRHAEAMRMWRVAVEVDPSDAVCWRNLGIGSYNVECDAVAAAACFARAVQAAPDDSRLLFESDQLAKRTGMAPEARLITLETRMDLVADRDDLTNEVIGLLVTAGRAAEALGILTNRHFQPWEGGEGEALRSWERVHLNLAQAALQDNRAADAEAHARAALDPPPNLGEAPHPLANRAHIYLVLGDALAARGCLKEAHEAWNAAASFNGDFQRMSVQQYSEKTYFSVLAWRRLGRIEMVDALLNGLEQYASDLGTALARVDFFATSLPTLLLFRDDLQKRQETLAMFLTAQIAAGRGEIETATQWIHAVLERDPNHDDALDLLRDMSRRISAEQRMSPEDRGL
jgi:tetratricopeptide (TPR) repeat protein